MDHLPRQTLDYLNFTHNSLLRETFMPQSRSSRLQQQRLLEEQRSRTNTAFYQQKLSQRMTLTALSVRHNSNNSTAESFGKRKFFMEPEATKTSQLKFRNTAKDQITLAPLQNTASPCEGSKLVVAPNTDYLVTKYSYPRHSTITSKSRSKPKHTVQNNNSLLVSKQVELLD